MVSSPTYESRSIEPRGFSMWFLFAKLGAEKRR